MKHKCIAVLFIMCSVVAACAQTEVPPVVSDHKPQSGGITQCGQTEAPTIVSDWLSVYEKSGEKEAMAVWFKGSPIETDTNATISISALFNRLETAYGKMIGFEPIRTVPVAPSFCRVYVLIKYERSPLFGVFECYKIDGKWAVTTVDFNVKASSILPAHVLEGQP